MTPVSFDVGLLEQMRVDSAVHDAQHRGEQCRVNREQAALDGASARRRALIRFDSNLFLAFIYLKRNLAKWSLPSVSRSTSIRQVPFHAVFVFQTYVYLSAAAS